MPAFTATVVDCFTRHAKRAAGLTCTLFGFDSNWIVVLDVAFADEDSLVGPGRVNILVHSPAQTFFYAAEEIAGMTFRFEVSKRNDRWWIDRTSRIE